jgi:hypothetical protein
MKMSDSRRVNREKETVLKMITLYCYDHHTVGDSSLCEDCQSLAEYAFQRIERCPYGIQKPTCAKCPIHCYRADEREAIRKVMRYSGPRMILRHPRLAILHLVDSLRKLPTR